MNLMLQEWNLGVSFLTESAWDRERAEPPGDFSHGQFHSWLADSVGVKPRVHGASKLQEPGPGTHVAREIRPHLRRNRAPESSVCRAPNRATGHLNRMKP